MGCGVTYEGRASHLRRVSIPPSLRALEAEIKSSGACYLGFTQNPCLLSLREVRFFVVYKWFENPQSGVKSTVASS